MPRMYIPEIGDLLRLTTAWQLRIYNEGRNNDVIEALELRNDPRWLALEEQTEEYIRQMAALEAHLPPYSGPWGHDPRQAERNAIRNGEAWQTINSQKHEVWLDKHAFSWEGEFPRKTVLRVDRIYIRKGNADFSSVTFYVVDTSIPALNPTERKKKVGSKGRRRFWAKLSDVNTMQFDKVEEE